MLCECIFKFYQLENTTHFIHNIIGFIQNPVSLENRQEHATFRKYATELLGLVLKENKVCFNL